MSNFEERESLVARIARVANENPKKIAVVCGNTLISYDALITTAQQVAMRLRDLEIGAEEAVGIIAFRGVEFVAGAIGVMAAGCCYVPLDPGLSSERMVMLLKQAGIGVVLMPNGAEIEFASHIKHALPVSISPSTNASTLQTAIDGSQLAYELFTSGSTGVPKLVPIEQRSVCAFLDGFDLITPPRSRVISTCICNFSFDVSVWEVFSALITAGTVHILSTDYACNPARLVDYIAEHSVTSTYVPPFVLDVFIDELKLNRSVNSLERVLVGVEPIIQSTLQRLRDLYPDMYIINGYGPTEATICSTLFPFEQAVEPSRRTPIGWPLAGWEINVCDEVLSPVPVGVVGEILVGGAGLARGYVGDPQLTAERFVIGPGGRRWYRTGDLGRQLPSGALEFVGRRDEQVKIRGFRVEVGEVEAALNSIPEVRAAVVLAPEGMAGRRLEAFVEGSVDGEELRRQLGRVLPDYMVPSRVVVVDRFPLTANGKVDRAALQGLARSRPMKGEFTAPSGALEQQLGEIWREVLELDVVGAHDNFFELGGNSLLALVAARQSAAALGDPSLAALLLRHTTIAEAARAIQNIWANETRQNTVSMDMDGETAIPASFGQAGLWTFQQLDLDNTAFVLPIAFRVSGPQNSQTLVKAVKLLFEHNETFRLKFRINNGELEQVCSAGLPKVEAELDIIPNAAIPSKLAAVFHDDALCVASLEDGPARARVLAIEGGDHIILIAAHHIVFDGSSLPVIVSQLAKLLCGGDLGSCFEGPRSFSKRQRLQVGGRRWQSDRSYWIDELTPVPDVLGLPLDHPRLPRRSGRGKTSVQILSDRGTQAVAKLARHFSTTSFAALLTTLAAMAHRFSGQDEFAIAIPTAASRADEKYREAVGYFVNLLPIRFCFQRDQGFSALLNATDSKLREGFCRGEFPFEAMLEALSLQGPDQATRFTRLVVAQDVDSGLPCRAGDVEIHELAVEHFTAKFELSVFVAERHGRHCLKWEYDSDVFTLETIERFQNAVEMLLDGAASEPNLPIGQIHLLTDAEGQQVITEVVSKVSNQTPVESIVDLFEEQVERAPSRVALESEHGPVTYGQLRDWALGIADKLSASGVVEESPVLVLVERSPDFIAAVLGVLYSGGCYVPIDGREPTSRVRTVCETAGAQHAIVSHLFESRIPPGMAIFSPARLPHVSALKRTGFPKRSAESLAYIMFTSGSTGQPKGVAIPDRGVVRLVRDQDFARFDSNDAFILIASLGFDAATLEIWGALLNGGRLVVPGDSVVRDPSEVAATIVRTRVSAGFFNVSFFRRILDSDASALKGMHTIIVGGEAIPASLIVSASEVLNHSTLVNGYGPTENTTFSCCHRFTEPPMLGRPVPIGRPISGSNALVVDEVLSPVPVGVVGEILVGGAGLARGYVGDPQLTAERFVIGPGGRRWYRTGDLGRQLPSGALEFVGRRDEQVKIRGFRVEVGEVEAALNSIPEVRAAVVLAPEGMAGRRLEAFVEGSVDGEELRRQLGRVLPDYMVPSRVVVVDRFPLTANGKVDRAALQGLARSRPMKGEFTAPSGALEQQLGEIWREVLELDVVGAHDNFFELGGNSLLIVILAECIGKKLGREIRVVDLLDRPTIASSAEFLGLHKDQRELSAPGTEPDITPRSKLKFAKPYYDRIAIVGLAGRFPGASNADALWKRSLAGAVDIQDVGSSRVGFVSRRGVLEGTDRFDAEFFGIPEREARFLDPQQRVLLEVAQHALDEAGIDPAQEEGVIAVYAACGPSSKLPYSDSLAEDYELNLANAPDFTAMRISYRLRLRGESVTVQTGCSSSLFAVHLASRSLLSGECDIALAGGVSFASDQNQGYAVEEGMITSPSGQCRPFDASADGTVPGGGAAMVVLMRLEDAKRIGACVRAVIIGTASNNDGGTKVGFMAPSPTGQSEVIAAAHKAAGVEARSVGYVETHGTATRLGDAIEIEGLRRAFALDLVRDQPCALGSLKANCGHLDRAAGIAGLVRAVLAVESGIIPPMAGFNQPNPSLSLSEAGFMVPRDRLPWPIVKSPRRAGISSFGVGGTNVHVVIEQAPTAKVAEQLSTARPVLLVLSGHTSEALAAQERALADHLESKPDIDLHQAARTLATGRRAGRYRCFVVASHIKDALVNLRSKIESCLAETAPRLAFAFPGQGDAEVEGFAGLYQDEPVYRNALDDCAERLLSFAKIDIRRDLYALSDTERQECFKDMSRHQPAMFAVEWALAELWKSWGVRPDVVLGHSLGEVVAAARAGVLNLDDALKLVLERSRLMQESAPGAILSVTLSPRLVEARLVKGTSIAAYNGRELVAVSGPADAISSLETILVAEGVKTRQLSIPRAPHSPMMCEAAKRLRESAKDLKFHPLKLPLLSNITGTWADDHIASSDYWATHLTSPVQFSKGLDLLADGPPTLILVLGSGSSLERLIEYEIGGKAVTVLSGVANSRSGVGERTSAITALGRLWAHGAPVNVAAPLGRPLPPKVRLPVTSFGHHRRWPSSIKRSAPTVGVGASFPRADDPGAWILEPATVMTDINTNRPVGNIRCISVGDDVPGRAEFESSASAAGCCLIRDERGLALLDPTAITDIVWWINGGRGDNLLSKAGLIARQAAVAQARVWIVTDSEGHNELTLPSVEALAYAAVRVAPLEEPLASNWHLISLRVSDPQTRAEGMLKALAANETHAILHITDRGLFSITTRRVWPHWRARPLHEKGCYVITGGMGRVGKALARALAREVPAHIILLGRRSVSAITADLLLLRTELERFGADVEYFQTDVTEREQITKCLVAVRKRHGRIDGLIHAAGFTDRAKFALLEATDSLLLEQVSAAKLLGVRNLMYALEDSDADFIFLCSSLSTVLGGVGFGAYVAANAALDDFAREQWSRGDCRWISIGWDAWLEGSERKDVGASRYALDDEDGYQVFKRALAVNKPVLLVSTGDIEIRLREVRSEIVGERSISAYGDRRNSSDTLDDSHSTIEKSVAAVLKDVLGRVPTDPARDLRDDGIESLTILQIVTRLRARLGVNISLADAMRSLTLAGLNELAAKARAGQSSKNMFRIEHIPTPLECPASSTQRRWLELMPYRFGSIDISVAIDGECDTPVLVQAVTQVVNRHSGLRTRFIRIEETWLQVIENRVSVEVHDLTHLTLTERMDMIRTLVQQRASGWFDVSKNPPFDLDVVRLDDNSHALLIHAHHVVFDGWSSSLFLRDIARAVNGQLNGEAPQYTDYAVAQARYLLSPEFVAIRDYWMRHFKGAAPPTRVAPDIDGTEGNDVGDFIPFEISIATLALLRTRAKKLRTTPFALMFAAYGMLLYELTGEEDLVFGTTAAGRPSPDTEEIIGVFVNPLPVRIRINRDDSLGSYLSHVNHVLIGFHEHQHYPLEDLVKHVEPFVGLGLNGAFHCYILYQNYWRPEGERLKFRRMNIEGLPHHKLMREFEIILEEDDNRLTGELWFRQSCFSVGRASEWERRYREIIESLSKVDLEDHLFNVLRQATPPVIVQGGHE